MVTVTGHNYIGDYYCNLSINQTEANLVNRWAVALSGRHAGNITRNGITKLYGRLKVSGESQTSGVFLNLPGSANVNNLDLTTLVVQKHSSTLEKHFESSLRRMNR